MNIKRAFDHWIFDSFEVSAEGLGLYRMFYAAFVLLFLTPGHSPLLNFGGVAALPEALFHPPPGPMMLFSDFPPAWVAQAISLLLIVSLVALLVGYRTRAASLLTGVLLLTGYGFAFSIGKINHVMLFVLLPIVMSASNWGAAYSIDAHWRPAARRDVDAWPLTLMALLVGFAMFTAGFSKLLGGWLDPTVLATQGHFLKQFFVSGRQDLLAPIFLSIDSVLFWKALDVATVLFEMGFLVAAFHPTATRLFAASAVLFHFSTMMMLNISFAIHLVVYAAFAHWTEMDDAVSSDLWARLERIFERPVTLALLGGGTAALLAAFGSPLMALDNAFSFTSDLTAAEVIAVTAAASIVVARAGQRLMNPRFPSPTRRT